MNGISEFSTRMRVSTECYTILHFGTWVSFEHVFFTNQKLWCWYDERNKLSAQSICIPLADGFISSIVSLMGPYFCCGLFSICTAHADWGVIYFNISKMFSKTELEFSTSLSHIVFLISVTFYLVNTTFDIYFDLFCTKEVVLKCCLKIDILFLDRCLLIHR